MKKQISFESICTDLSSVVLPDYLSTKDVLFFQPNPNAK